MSVSRSIATRLLQGMKLLLDADSDIQAFEGGVRIGPLVPDATNGDSVIKPRQINLMIAPNIGLDSYLSSHVSNTVIPVVIAFYDFFAKESVSAASPNLLAYDYFEHIQSVLMAGTEGNGDGKIVNPDDPTNPAAILKYLNIAAPEFRTTIMGVAVEPLNIARCYAAIATYPTREDIRTRGRA